MKVYLNAEKLTEKQSAHEYLKFMLDLPEYYGNNLDALYDCLSEFSDLTLVIVNSDAGGYFSRLLPVMQDACRVKLI
ncbi:MAG: barstar family protein [Lachnospiraceae bacterium]|nr:barstar family protein [Lachnospiraceae bacterium]